MTRHMVGANSAVFCTIDEHCRLAGQPLDNAGKPRWIATSHEDRDFFMHAQFLEVISFSARRKAAWVVHAERYYLISVGFSFDGDPEGLTELELLGGHLTTVLAELTPAPTADALQIKNIIEASDKNSDSDYQGHDSSLVEILFPTIRLFNAAGSTPPWNIFFRIALMECRWTGHWLDKELLTLLNIIADLDQTRIPYRVLCRSIFDVDPSSFFLALYRCLEALFAYSSARDVVVAMKVGHDWSEVASILEDKLGWFPHEDRSLERLLKSTVAPELRRISLAIDPKSPIPEASDIVALAARRIYKLRNSIVHYRPSQYDHDLQKYDWVAICRCMATIVLDVYYDVFP
ncbi:hypothetical protein [Devosia psychrophila]|uniref:Apea-like HEPN domain-containing protein n=1 Tax=Devosia psychrophila TaxID=728005 RepID=A0A0F5PR68_9HYPH|nr:hypothetical protein [Devosia psychrophila]KKC31080.1 hypothetical protein WH91_21705 [Devosia psychrophila]SFD14608.1 hypothetical protein SAMN04488059_12367 [Devosia psychrophila]